MEIFRYLIAYGVSLYLGGIVAREWVVFLKRRIEKTAYDRATRSGALDWSIGILERSITTTLIIWAPTLAAPFIGGWIALKFAANWEKREAGDSFEDQQRVARHRLTSIVGSTASILIAVICGLVVNPHASSAWMPDSKQVQTVRVIH